MQCNIYSVQRDMPRENILLKLDGGLQTSTIGTGLEFATVMDHRSLEM